VGAFLFLLSACQVPPRGSQSDELRIGASDLGGTVSSGNGPEAGVWVIAETTDLPTKFARIVVTDDFDGRIDDPNAGWKGRGLWPHPLAN
jgi:hypothetical protein